MANRQVRLVVGLVTPFVALWLANWFDGQFVFDARQTAARSFDVEGAMVASDVGMFATAVLSLAVALVAWWSRSRLVAVVDIVLGGFYGFLLALEAFLALRINGAPAFAPEPLATFIDNRYGEVMLGSMGSVEIVGAAMFVAGIATLIRSYREAAPTGSAATA